MQPIPETVDALRELTREGDPTIAQKLWAVSHAVQQVVPEIIGLSLSFVEGRLTFTMTATAERIAELDGMQYLDGGPCEETMRTGRPNHYRAGEAHDEEQWQMFARATAAAGVASTLSLPIVHNETVIGGVNLYAATTDAFDGHHAELADVCGAWAGGATTNADLDFTTRFEAVETPGRIRSDRQVDRAIGALISHSDLDPVEAEDRLRDAARRAGISDAQLAGAVLDLFVAPPAG